jgi:hypothetical protein
MQMSLESQLQWLRHIDELLEAFSGQLAAYEGAEVGDLIVHGEPARG